MTDLIEDCTLIKLFGLVFSIIIVPAFGYITWNYGYSKGYKSGLEENPKAKEVYYFIQKNGKIIRFYGDRLLRLDLEENTVETLFPYKETLGEKK